MRLSLSWLADYVEVLETPEELARRLTMAGLEVEGIERPGAGLAGVVVGQILESSRHPNADKLSVTRVEIGQATGPLQIVCGAKNYRVGDKVPVATVGTALPNGVVIKQTALRGVDSFGMLCSAKELGQAEDSSGLLILGAGAEVGSPVARALGLDDVVMEVNVTPNRADALSHLGLAREVAALCRRPLKRPAFALSEATGEAGGCISIRIEDRSRCVRYAARVIEGVTVKDSPEWLQHRLRGCGVRAINNLVDATNYVLMEYGQPLHAFDLDAIAGGQIVVRTARPGERLTTLDGKDRVLDADDLLICDRDRPLVLAGVMGGASSEVTGKTRRVLLECATFLPAAVRRASKRHGLHTESSHRFERGTDVSVVPEALDRAAALIVELAGGAVLRGRVDAYPEPRPLRSVALRERKVAEILGGAVPMEEVVGTLERLGFRAVARGVGEVTFEVPGARVDVAIEEDLIEELARVRGYDSIPARAPHGAWRVEPRPAAQVLGRVRAALSGEGFNEVVNYSFVSPAELAAFRAEEGAVAVSNPLSVEHSVMRTTLLPSLVQNVVRAVRHQATGVRFYEVARSYRRGESGAGAGRPPAVERDEVAGAVWGVREGAKSWTSKEATADFFDAKGAVEAVLGTLGVKGVSYRPLESPWYHPRASAEVVRGNTVLGTVGELHPRAMKALDAPGGVHLFQLDLEELRAGSTLLPQAVALSKFPAVIRDVALVVPADLHAERVRTVILEVGGPLLEDAQVFDVYVGQQVGEGRKNLAFSLRFLARDRTLTDAEVVEAHSRIVSEVTRRFGGALRT